ncbi:uncharacterized protein LY79DRAFT_340820 [Colletotrichum navitas]|uniref:Uncharacterized protein n=1 Tax=Colletotrichum navitas TaxID=681940 RepID=A0AAD8V0W5_9PEZI|nr:uncharacterized protein LY79DRAFT_340820 [Colletotrichum navitas]KAK1579531.1 hypothetical protein LY79DRAFT_340820 [Colletotrichum navitas]
MVGIFSDRWLLLPPSFLFSSPFANVVCFASFRRLVIAHSNRFSRARRRADEPWLQACNLMESFFGSWYVIGIRFWLARVRTRRKASRVSTKRASGISDFKLFRGGLRTIEPGVYEPLINAVSSEQYTVLDFSQNWSVLTQRADYCMFRFLPHFRSWGYNKTAVERPHSSRTCRAWHCAGLRTWPVTEEPIHPWPQGWPAEEKVWQCREVLWTLRVHEQKLGAPRPAQTATYLCTRTGHASGPAPTTFSMKTGQSLIVPTGAHLALEEGKGVTLEHMGRSGRAFLLLFFSVVQGPSRTWIQIQGGPVPLNAADTRQ